MKTIAEFIEEHGITMESTPVPENPNMSGDMPEGSGHYHCVLAMQRGASPRMTAYYSVGPGIIEQWANKPIKLGPPGNPYKRGTVAYAEALKERAKRYRPDLADLLDCLASDAASIWAESSFEDWAESLGYDTDSRAAERTYGICRTQALKLKHFLACCADPKACQELLYTVERL